MSTAVAEPVTAISTFAELRRRAREVGPKRLGIVHADDEVALSAASEALCEGLAHPILIGDEFRIRARAELLGLFDLIRGARFIQSGEPALTAVEMARAGALDLLMKGHLRTDELLHPVLDRQTGLRSGHLLCDIALCEFPGPAGSRLIGLSDGGINVAPTLDQKRQIVLAAIDVLHSIGILHPKIAVMSALEVVTDAMPSTRDAQSLAELAAAGAFGDAEVYGPLALDGALLEWAARAKGITHPVAGHADFLLMPNIEAGNMLAKSVIFLAGWQFAHVVAGAKVPILIPSRVESAQQKVNSIALGVLYAAR
ncbi:MAG TPA: phosphate acyltransferase [Terracidiphilus sp.]|jgi:phosphate butyryltransferase